MRCIFLDRDGTIVRERNFMRYPWEVEPVPGAVEAVRRMKELGYLLIVISNQSGVGRGIITMEDVLAVEQRIREIFSGMIDRFYYCPSRPEENAWCRKPNPGMVEDAMREFDIDIKESWVVGDRCSDVELADRVGARGVLVLTGYGQRFVNRCSPFLIASDILAFARYLERSVDMPLQSGIQTQ